MFYKQWEGVVTEVGDTEFTASIVFDDEEIVGEIAIGKVSELDRPLIANGAPFNLCLIGDRIAVRFKRDITGDYGEARKA